ncbi:amidohydrolase family protein [Burkholderia gladioli pv. gladioli]|uniref:Amidohydrolase n=1 Tax=Burkholderia gladioli TaxID=28095 RepID=A0A095HB92_BURGA|nr:amidohydrolase family protein [Burkholderia gladioli]AJW98476.1 WD domain, G-beta repeat family protein [Burkholderia gladioli]ASD79877.1 amidohydrolase [Burkholderia gladioli pv. gladioli]AWY54880.1 amidohydrolase [Burkholderia gladioli pv. gladioli]KGC10889.1 WD domain, G-beta repeat family protein [Burkholderia gladioli]MDJ1164143.1 amidohydrolase family protein [Burkholderia gladioli pv. gladioli]
MKDCDVPHPLPDEAKETDVTGSTITVELTEGTSLAIALSPDGRTIAMDLQGILWTMRVEGGTARRLTDDFGDIARPQWSSDGSRIVFQSYRSGNFHLWSIDADGTHLNQLTHGEFDCREPRFSPDGRELAFASDLSGRYAIYAMDLATGARRLLSSEHAASEASEPCWSPDGHRVVFVRDGALACADRNGIDVTTETVAARCSHPGAVVGAPAWTPDGRSLVYRVALGSARDMRASRLFVDGVALTGDDEDVFPFPIVWLDHDRFLYTSDGKIRCRSLSRGALGTIPFAASVQVTKPQYTRKYRDFHADTPRKVKGLSFPVLSPDARHVAFGALNQLWLLTIGDPQPVALSADPYAKIWPAFSPDGTRLAYICDRAGNMDIWVRELASGIEVQLTDAGHALKQCKWSPDGMQIACASQDGFIYRVDAVSGSMRRELHQTVWSGRPDWSPDGMYLVLAAVRPYSARFREGRNAILIHELASGRLQYHDPSPTAGDALDVRNANGPIWLGGADANGVGASRLLFTMRGTLWSLPLDAHHMPCAAPLPLGDETADAISASADGRHVMFLSNARLRLLDLTDGTVSEVPLDLTWTPHSASGRTVVRAGKLWDGVADHSLNDMDIVVEHGHIVSIAPHDPTDAADRQNPTARYIDARAYTVMPGLTDMHTHREMGNQLGAREPRIFLSFGITSTRGLSDNPYLALENKESVDAGARIGPRSFATGDALDGTRTFWDGMRPIGGRQQLERELGRAQALDYDLIKCYVRLPPDLQQMATRGAHALGIPVTSHYLFPAMAFGADGYEHMGGTSRFGYSRTGSALGRMYQDVLAISAAAECYRTPTLFGLESMLADSPAWLYSDRRLKTLFKPDDLSALQHAADSEPGRYIPMVASQVQAIDTMMRAGVRIVTGSDFPIVAPGISLHLNLRAMVRYGMTPVDALRTATSVSGSALHPNLGTLRPGALADVVFVSGDPTSCIDDAANVEAVMVGGEYRTLDELIEPFAGTALKGHSARHSGTAPPPAVEASHTASATHYWWHDARWIECVNAACCSALMPIPSLDGSDAPDGADPANRSGPVGPAARRVSRWSGAYRSGEA